MNTQDVLIQASESYGFLGVEQVAVLAADPVWRLRKLLIRHQTGRLLTAAQDVASTVATLERGGSYVRDVSIPAADPFWKRVR